MALANEDHIPNHNSTMAIIQASAFYDRKFAKNSSNDVHRIITSADKIGSPEKATNLLIPPSNSSSASSPSSTNSNGLGYQAGSCFNLSEEDHNSVITFKPAEFGINNNNNSNNPFCSNGSFLSFDAAKRMPQSFFSKVVGDGDEYPVWAEDSLNLNQELINGLSGIPYAATASNNGLPFDWMNDDEANNVGQELAGHEGGSTKRPYTGGDSNNQVVKKQCAVATANNGSKKPNKAKSASPSKDTQSLAAKNRRERISERLKILQDLVPNGSKVDLVTMLEKAIGYVKFLQLQVKVLATDEFWPAQGGKAPDLSQVREAIDAILASQRSDRNSTPK